MRNAQTALILLVAVVSCTETAAAQPVRGGAANVNQGVLNRTADALLALKSTRFSIKREGAPAFLDEKTGLTFTAADCMYAAPDRVSCDVKVSLKNGNVLQVTRVWVPEGTFQSNPLTKQWAKVPPDSNFNGSLLFAKTGIADLLRTSIQKVQSFGKEKVQNTDTLHFKGEVSGQKLVPLIGTTVQPDSAYPVDLWTDEKSSNTVQLHVTEPDGNGWLIELFGTNEPIDIATPRLSPPPPGRL